MFKEDNGAKTMTQSPAMKALDDVKGRLYSLLHRIVEDKNAPVFKNVKKDFETICTALQSHDVLVGALKSVELQSEFFMQDGICDGAMRATLEIIYNQSKIALVSVEGNKTNGGEG
jgi:hypothetical protein